MNILSLFNSNRTDSIGQECKNLDMIIQTAWVIIYTSLYLVTLGIIGNFSIIYYFISKNAKKIHRMSSYHFLLIKIAVIDFSICAIAIPTQIFEVEAFENTSWLNMIGMPVLATSFGLLVLISFLRYQCIVYPFKKKLNKRYCFYGFLFLLFISWSIYAPLGLLEHGGHLDLLMISVDFIVAIIAFSISVFFYHQSCRVLRKSQEADDRVKKRNQKALKTLKYLIVQFSCSILFTRLLVLVLRALRKEITLFDCTGHYLIFIGEVLAVELIYLNSIGNLFVYLKMMPDFRSFVMNVVCCCRRKTINSL